MRTTVALLIVAASSLSYGDDMASWYPFHAANTPQRGEIGMQDWIERPAGKYGRIVREGDRLLYHGQPIKLWGLNLCFGGGCAPEKPLAERRAAFYAKYGINSVRLHKYADGVSWAGIQSPESFTRLDPNGLDRMDYQIAQFKEAGIYVLLSAHFGSVPLAPGDKQYVPYMDELKLNEKDGRVVMQHSAIYYSPELQDVQIRHTVNLLKHKNPYTGLTYAEDPAIAFVEFMNEQSVLFYTSTAPLKASPTLRKHVGARFCEWLKAKYGTREKLLAAWGADSLNRFAREFKDAPPEDLQQGTILPIGSPYYWDPDTLARPEWTPVQQRLLDTLEFLYGLQSDFYRRYGDAVREAGYQGELIGSNWQAGRAYSHFANLHTDYLVGTIDRHNYYRWSGGSLLQRPGSGLLSAGMQQVVDRPFMLSEWLQVFPNDFYAESVAIIGAYGMGLQGWDVSYIFQNQDEAGFSESLGRFDVPVPNVLGLFPAISRQVLRGDVRESQRTAVRNVHVPSLFQARLGFDDKVVQGYDEKELDSSKVPARALAVARQAVTFTDKFQETPVFDMQPYEHDGSLVASTGQLRWREGESKQSGYFTLDTAGTKAVAGFAEGQTCVLGDLSITPASSFCTIYVTALGRDESIATAKKLLVTAMARVRNTGMELEETDKGIKARNKGTGPMLLEPVRATLEFGRAGPTRVVLLDHDGLRTAQTIPVRNGVVEIDGTRDRTPYYLIEFD